MGANWSQSPNSASLGTSALDQTVTRVRADSLYHPATFPGQHEESSQPHSGPRDSGITQPIGARFHRAAEGRAELGQVGNSPGVGEGLFSNPLAEPLVLLET